MKIYIGADYRGFNLKKELIGYLESKKLEVVDLGGDGEDTNDYCDYAFSVGEKVRDDKGSLGILICGSGIGMCVAANKVRGVRCNRCVSENDAMVSRNHDGVNVLAIGSEVTTDIELVKRIVDTFIMTSEPNLERRIRRIEKIKKYEESR